jgi:hypothetical protein
VVAGKHAREEEPQYLNVSSGIGGKAMSTAAAAICCCGSSSDGCCNQQDIETSS